MTYPIVSWEVFQTECNNQPKPSFYFTLDPRLKKFLKDNKDTLQIRIKDTGSLYDNRVFIAMVNKSANMPNDRPNFYDATGYYVMSFDAAWMGYPKSNGSFEIVEGVLTSYKQTQDLLEMATIPPTTEGATLTLKSPLDITIDAKDDSVNKMNLWIFVLILIILLIAAFGFTHEKKSIRK